MQQKPQRGHQEVLFANLNLLGILQEAISPNPETPSPGNFNPGMSKEIATSVDAEVTLQKNVEHPPTL